MTAQLNAVEISQVADGSWMALHEPSGRSIAASSQQAATEAMREILGMDVTGQFTEPSTADRFEGVGLEIALYLEGTVSKMLALHAGFARLEAYQDAIASVRLGGGCQGCPSSRLTLLNSVRLELQDRFGEEVLIDVFPVLD